MHVALNWSVMQQEPKQKGCANVGETPPPSLYQKQILWAPAPFLEDCVNTENTLTLHILQISGSHYQGQLIESDA